MKKMLVILTALMLLFTTALATEGEGELTFDQAQARIDSQLYLNLIDIRDEESYNAGHLPGAGNMPLNLLQDQMQQILDSGFSYMDTEIIIYGEAIDDCAKGAETVRSLGFTNVTYMGNFSAWPYDTITTEEEIAQSYRILGGMNARDIHGEKVTEAVLSDYRLTMVNVWATYCNPCLAEMPDLARLAADMKDQGVQILGVVSDSVDQNLNRLDDKIALAISIEEMTGANYTHIVPDLIVAQKLLYQISSVPTTFFLDANGELVGYVYVGSRDYSAWKAIIEETLALLPDHEVAP